MQLLRVIKTSTHFRKLALAVTALVIAGAVVYMLAPLAYKCAIDAGINTVLDKQVESCAAADWLYNLYSFQLPKPEFVTYFWVAVYAFLLILTVLCSNYWYYWFIWYSKEEYELMYKVTSKLMQLSLKYFHQDDPGKLNSRIGKGISNMIRATTESIIGVVPQIMAFIIAIIVFPIYGGWKITLIALIPIIIFVISSIRAYKIVTPYIMRARELDEDIEKIKWQAIGGIRAVISSQMQRFLEKKMRSVQNQLLQNQIALENSFNFGQRMRELTINMGRTAVLACCLYGVLHKDITIGATVLLMSYSYRLYDPLWYVSHIVFDRVLRQYYKMQRVFAVFDEPIEIENSKNPVKYLPNVNIVFDHVNFAFPCSEEHDVHEALLENLCLEIRDDKPEGKMIALVGPTGSGKSTLFTLILRYYDVLAGRITIGGTDLRNIALSYLRKLIVEVPQEANEAIFDGTFWENIVCGQDDPEIQANLGLPVVTREQVIKAAKSACIYSLIVRKGGFQVIVGEKGVRLSGGEKQRLVFARAFLRTELCNSKIILLDEPTSSLDSETETAVEIAMTKLKKGRILLVIAHRLSTIFKSDHIFVLDEGAIDDQGTHKYLAEQGGLYTRMLRKQMGVEEC